MKRLIILIIGFSIYSYASLIGSNFSQRDLQILEDLDIKSSFITDYKLQEVYEQYQSSRNSRHYVTKLNEASLFVPRVKDILKQEGIPDVFIYMAMAESNFNIDARSSVRATGLWQFMLGTGLRYGLKNDLYVDERMDLVKSTVAATKYLNALHKRFDKWYLAAISYNCGEGRVIEALT
ncbi:MAG: lytic transglycosylase domain-containing protein, partial [Halarcobacter sp.]